MRSEYDPTDFGNAFQNQFKRSMGLPGEPPAGGGGGPMPIPEGGPHWRQGNGFMGGPVGDLPTGGGGGPMPIPDGGPGWRNGLGDQQVGGGGGPMPIPGNTGMWGHPFGGQPPYHQPDEMPMNFGGAPPIDFQPRPYGGSTNQEAPPNAGMMAPLRGPRGGYQPPTPLRGPRGGWQPPTPQANQAQAAPLRGPRGGYQPPTPQTFQFNPQPQQGGWNWNDLTNIYRRRF